jgi:hypothetical protein
MRASLIARNYHHGMRNSHARRHYGVSAPSGLTRPGEGTLADKIKQRWYPPDLSRCPGGNDAGAERRIRSG